MKFHIPDFGHVPDRMRQRSISEEDIETVLVNFTTSWTSSHSKSRVYQGKVEDGRVIRVVVVEPPDPDGTLQIKTVYESSEEGSV